MKLFAPLAMSALALMVSTIALAAKQPAAIDERVSITINVLKDGHLSYRAVSETLNGQPLKIEHYDTQTFGLNVDSSYQNSEQVSQAKQNGVAVAVMPFQHSGAYTLTVNARQMINGLESALVTSRAVKPGEALSLPLGDHYTVEVTARPVEATASN